MEGAPRPPLAPPPPSPHPPPSLRRLAGCRPWWAETGWGVFSSARAHAIGRSLLPAAAAAAPLDGERAGGSGKRSQTARPPPCTPPASFPSPPRPARLTRVLWQQNSLLDGISRPVAATALAPWPRDRAAASAQSRACGALALARSCSAIAPALPAGPQNAAVCARHLSLVDGLALSQHARLPCCPPRRADMVFWARASKKGLGLFVCSFHPRPGSSREPDFFIHNTQNLVE